MEKKSFKKYLSKEEALGKMQRYCAFQERCLREVRSKLIELGIYGQSLEDIMAGLISDNFLNEERFARSFARGKFRMNQWGKNRIWQELKSRQISDYCLRKAMEEINEEQYRETLQSLLEKKAAYLKNENDDYVRKNKLAQYAIRRGFEPELVWEMLK